jgi:uncharacterized protein (DUF1800 family)
MAAQPPIQSRAPRLHLLALVSLLVLQACTNSTETATDDQKNNLKPTNTKPARILSTKAAPTKGEAARFLSQATFGPTEAEINALNASTAANPYDAWLTTQFTAYEANRELHYSHMLWLEDTNLNPNPVDINNFVNTYAIESFWKQAITRPDQLRQRVAWAYSQIFVVGELDNVRNSSYHDLLAKNAFGNYRTLLEDITLSPAMGQWLSHIGNQKEDPALGRLPDENYAREVMQLFSIGLWQLNQDGTRKLDAQNQPIPTYDQEDIRGMAKVLTGWTYPDCDHIKESWYCIGSARSGYYRKRSDVVNPMKAIAAYHSVSEKNLINGVVLPANQTAEKDLKDALDLLFNHPNVGPFIGKQMIQRLVKSNPSPAYVSRVAAAFNNNGAGVRGDMKAVIRAILLDVEARDITQAQTASAGKMREPVVRLAQFMRVFTTPPPDSSRRYDIDPYWMNNVFAQRPLSSPSVFNFYRPDYSPPGEMSTNGLVGPELQILHEATIIDTHNYLTFWVTSDPATSPRVYQNYQMKHNYASFIALAADPTALVNKLDLLLTSETMSAEAKAAIVKAVTNVNGSTEAGKKERFTQALLLFQMSPDYQIQK